MKVYAGILAAVVALGMAAPSWAGGMIRLHKQAVVEGGTVRVGDVALLSGVDGGEKLSEVVVAEGMGMDGTRVKAEEILFAVAAQRGAAAAKDLAVTGASECVVTRNDGGEKTPARVETMVVLPSGAPALPATPSAAAAKVTLGGLLIERVCQELATPREDVRVEFETISPWLDTAVGANQRWQFRALVRGGIGTLQWEAQLMEGARVVTKVTVMAKVTRRQQVLVATGTVGRGEVLGESGAKAQEIWLDRNIPTLAAKASEVVGLETMRPIAAGTMLDTRDFKAAEMAAREEMITVYAVSGNLVVKGSAKAMEGGKMHDSIRVKNAATGEIFAVRLIGKRVATAGGELDEATEKKLREMQ